jgi:hypothetical protein
MSLSRRAISLAAAESCVTFVIFGAYSSLKIRPAIIPAIRRNSAKKNKNSG